MCCVAGPQDLLPRIREHLREYVSHLPDYTCRVTIDRSTRRSARAELEFVDRLRLEVAYTGGNELYAWPGSEAFESSIEELLPAHGLVSNGSYAIHIRTLFLHDVTSFGEPRTSGGHIALDASVPAVLSGFSLTTGAGSVPAGIDATLWLDPTSLDLERLQVRVVTRLAQSVETTTYGRDRVGEVEFVLPQTSELVLTDRGGMQFRNVSRFDQYHRFAGTSTISFGPGADTPAKPAAAVAKKESIRPAAKIAGTLDAAIGADAAIGDPFTVTAEGGAKLTGRLTDMRREGRENWYLELTLMGRAERRTGRLPIPAGTKLTWGKM